MAANIFVICVFKPEYFRYYLVVTVLLLFVTLNSDLKKKKNQPFIFLSYCEDKGDLNTI